MRVGFFIDELIKSMCAFSKELSRRGAAYGDRNSCATLAEEGSARPLFGGE
jgi:hypothetical protein